MKTYNFRVVVEPDEDFDGNPAGWHAYCPALERLGGATWGETREQALKNINEVVHMIVQELIEEGKSLPDGPEDSVEVAEISEEDPPYRGYRPGMAARGKNRFLAAAALQRTDSTEPRTSSTVAFARLRDHG